MSFNKLKCPFCSSLKIKKNGKAHNTQRYFCNSCRKSFTSTTNTFFYSSKKPISVWYKFIEYMIHDETLEAIQDYIHISSRTAYMWRLKFYKCFSKYTENIVLQGVVWIDEAYVSVSPDNIIRINNKKLRGISINQIAVACAVDNQGHSYAKVAGRGHLSAAKVIDAYGDHIKPGSNLIHDGFRGHEELIRYLNLNETFTKSTTKESKKLLQPVNSFIAQIKRNIFLHVGGKKDYLQDYLNWVCYKRTLKGINIKQKVKKVYQFCIDSQVDFMVKDRYDA